MKEIASFTGGHWVQKKNEQILIKYVGIDSRKISDPRVTLFIAIKTRHKDANEFLLTLYNSGLRNIVTDSDKIELVKMPLANIIQVKNTTKALQQIAAAHRALYPGLEVIGITGSNGKTVVKEWLYQLLQKKFTIVRSPKSYNSQVGVPLSVLQIDSNYDLGIFEAGISMPGEMEKLEKMIAPGIGIFTNAGSAHSEGFLNQEEKIREKLVLFKKSKIVVYCSDNKLLQKEIKIFHLTSPDLNFFSWSNKKNNDLQILSLNRSAFSTRIDGLYQNKKVSITIPFNDEASIENAIHCWCILILLKKSSAIVLAGFKKLFPLAMRMELKHGIHHCTIINDSYSNDVQSLTIALDFLQNQKRHQRHTVILSDILQSGTPQNALYQNVASLLQHKKIDRLFAIGPQILKHKKEFNFLKEKYFFSNTDAFLNNIFRHHFFDETILIKGARHFEFENINRYFEEKIHKTTLSVNLTAIAHNLKNYKARLHADTKIMAVIKAGGYGSGSHEVASVLEYQKIDYLAVAYADEAIVLRNAGILLPVMVMNIDDANFEALIKYNLEPEIFSLALLQKFLEWGAINHIKNWPVHIKIDTGMHRLGFLPHEIIRLCQLLQTQKIVKVKSVFSHLAASGDAKADVFTKKQFKSFQSITDKIEKSIGYKFYRHIANTTAIARFPDMQLDMVRPGIGLYGVESNPSIAASLRNANVLTTTISQIKKVKKGESVGYGRKYLLKKNKIVAIVRIGYADGYPRSLGNGAGKMLVSDFLAPVIGDVCMDMTMLDVSGIKNVHEGDEVIVFGEGLPVQQLAEWAHTIPYEILTGISERVKRVYFEE